MPSGSLALQYVVGFLRSAGALKWIYRVIFRTVEVTSIPKFGFTTPVPRSSPLPLTLHNRLQRVGYVPLRQRLSRPRPSDHILVTALR